MQKENTLGKGYVHIYTGNGKGKTTAALGLALRAAGRGLKTVIVQFMKGQYYGELDSVKVLSPNIAIEQFGTPAFLSLKDNPDPDDVNRARMAIRRLHELMQIHGCDILVADEIITAMGFHLLKEDDIISIIDMKPEGMELVLTGRGATSRLIDRADLVTEMREVKHYYRDGVIARKGIEM